MISAKPSDVSDTIIPRRSFGSWGREISPAFYKRSNLAVIAPDVTIVASNSAVGLSEYGAFDWAGIVDGTALNSDVTLLFFSTDEIGKGPTWHVHPYDEIFIIRRGHALFTIGDTVIEAKAGDVLMGPAAVPHKYHNIGPGPLETTDIHLSREWIQTDLTDPDV